ncbi:MAG: hypothetical protein ACP5N9_04375 [Candidatus Bilamarchaeum sp.]
MKLIQIIKTWKYWSETYGKATDSLIPKTLGSLSGTSETLTFKMMSSFELELVLKTYCLVLFYEPQTEFDINGSFEKFLKKEGLWTHSLKTLLTKIKKKDTEFKLDCNGKYLENAVKLFDCFEEARYPFSTKEQLTEDLFRYNNNHLDTLNSSRRYVYQKIIEYLDKHEIYPKEPDLTEPDTEPNYY